MFAARYFAPRYFAPRYWPNVGDVLPDVGGGYWPGRYWHKNYFAGRYWCPPGSVPIVVPPEPEPGPTTDFRVVPGGVAKQGRDRRRKITVEIDGEVFTVRDADEAAALLEQAKQIAQEQAPGIARSALNRSRKQERKTGKYVAPEVAVPEVKLLSGGSDAADMVAAYQRAIDEIYLSAARDVELAKELRRRIAEDEDEDDTITMLLLH